MLLFLKCSHLRFCNLRIIWQTSVIHLGLIKVVKESCFTGLCEDLTLDKLIQSLRLLEEACLEGRSRCDVSKEVASSGSFELLLPKGSNRSSVSVTRHYHSLPRLWINIYVSTYYIHAHPSMNALGDAWEECVQKQFWYFSSLSALGMLSGSDK